MVQDAVDPSEANVFRARLPPQGISCVHSNCWPICKLAGDNPVDAGAQQVKVVRPS